MDPFQLLLVAFQALGGAFCAVLWYNYKEGKNKLDLVEREHSAYKLHVAETYVTKLDLRESLATVLKKMDRIEEKIDILKARP